jgi:hypothetical protein
LKSNDLLALILSGILGVGVLWILYARTPAAPPEPPRKDRPADPAPAKKRLPPWRR